MSGYIVYLNASDFLVGLLNNSASWAAIIALFSFLIYERMKKRKNLLIVLNILSRLLICSTVFLPMIFKDAGFVQGTAAAMIITGNIMWGIYGIGTNVWMMNLLLPESRNQYIYTRTFFLRISFTLSTIVMGFLLDWLNKSYTGFLVIYLTSLVFSLIDAVILINTKEKENIVSKSKGPSLKDFFEPLKNAEFRSFLMFIFFFYLMLTTSSSYTSLYFIKYLNFNYGFISVVNVTVYMLMIVCTRFWSRVEEKKGFLFVFRITALILILEFFTYGFLTSDRYYLLFPASILSGIGSSGFNISVFTYRYDIMPSGKKTLYEGWYGAIFGLSVLISPVIGNYLLTRLPQIHNAFFQYSNFQILYFISFISAAAVIYITFYRTKAIGRSTCDKSTSETV